MFGTPNFFGEIWYCNEWFILDTINLQKVIFVKVVKLLVSKTMLFFITLLYKMSYTLLYEIFAAWNFCSILMLCYFASKNFANHIKILSKQQILTFWSKYNISLQFKFGVGYNFAVFWGRPQNQKIIKMPQQFHAINYINRSCLQS